MSLQFLSIIYLSPPPLSVILCDERIWNKHANTLWLLAFGPNVLELFWFVCFFCSIFATIRFAKLDIYWWIMWNFLSFFLTRSLACLSVTVFHSDKIASVRAWIEFLCSFLHKLKFTYIYWLENWPGTADISRQLMSRKHLLNAVALVFFSSRLAQIMRFNKIMQTSDGYKKTKPKKRIPTTYWEQNQQPLLLKWFLRKPEHCPTKKNSMQKQIINIFIRWLAAVVTENTTFGTSLFCH